MERRKSEQRWADFGRENPALLAQVRNELRIRGPLRNRDLEGKSVANYRASKDTGVALYYLWLTGELMSYSRRGNERVYDFLENVAPEHLQWQASEEDAIRFFTHKGVAHEGLVSERDFRNILKSASNRPIDAIESKLKLAEMVESGPMGSLRLEGQTLYFLAADAPLFADLADGLAPPAWRPVHATTEDEVVL